MLKYGASAADYFEFEFYDKKKRARQKFVCWKLKKKFMHTMNDYSEEKSALFNNKVRFLERFGAYIHRDWLDVSNASYEAFCDFIDRHPAYIVKPQNLSCGRGIRKETCDKAQARELYDAYRAEGALLEEIIVQHEKMASLYQGSVNTIRVAAVCTRDSVEILGAVLRCGSGSGCIDNYCAGGYAAKVDPEAGIVVSDGCNITHDRVVKHPDTGVYFHGFAIPYWDEVVSMINAAAREVEGVRYIGWDVAIGKDGPLLIEGNFEGMFNILQQPANAGIKQRVLEILKQENK